MKKELTNQEKNEYIFILSLLSNLFGIEKKIKVPQNIDYNRVHKIAADNCISNMISYAVTKANLKIPHDISKSLIYKQKFMLFKDASQFSATKKLIEAFETNGIDNLLVKGQFIKNCYEQPDFRFMSDVDIHVKAKDFEKIKKIVTDLDFKTGTQTDDLLIVYQEPFVEVELHGDNGMFTDTEFNNNLFINAKLQDGKKHTYEFTLDDHYIYIVEHFAKHFRDLGGMGIKMMTDIYHLQKAFSHKINKDYVYKRLRASGTLNFYRTLISKCKKYFELGMTIDNFDMVDIFILSNPMFGTEEVLMYNKRIQFEEKYLNSDNESYLIKRLFPPKSRMIEDYPVLKRAGVLLPLTWVHRGVKIAFSKNRKQYKENITKYKKYNNLSEIEYLKQVMKKAGF
ncbi:MAG: nucleotidyltransferase family protein [Oscillospiraceae bacterium]|nr:nucleotidyltransferase family protein [Oscillospiraceae bacterium]